MQGWGGEVDDTPSTIGETQASRVENLYRRRNVYKRRGGFSALAASLGAATVRLLEWVKISDTEHLVEVHDGDVRDWFHATPGTVFSNGTDKLPASGATDANSAFVEGMLVLGNGIDPNVRLLPGGGSNDTAADLNGTDEYFENTGSTDLEAGNIDFTLAAWVYLDTTGIPQVVVSKWSATTSSQREYRIWFNDATDKFVMGVWDFGSGTGQEAAADNGTAIVPNTWYYVVGWHDSVNNLVGCQVNNATAVTAAWSLGVIANSVDFRIGAQSDVPAFLDGRIMRVGYWKSAGGAGGVLSAGLKTSLYNSGSGKAYASLTAGEKVALVAYWNLNNASGDDAHSALTTNDVTPVNAPGTAQGVDFERAVAALVVPAPTTLPTVDLDVGLTHESDGETQGQDFVYRIAFLNADGIPGEPGGEALDAAYTFALDFTANLTNIPQPAAGYDATGIRIWRRSGGSLLFKKVADIAVGTTSYLDEVENAELGESLQGDVDGVYTNTNTPPLRFFCEHNGRLVGANGEDNELVITNKFAPQFSPEVPDLEDVTQGTRDRVQSREGGRLTGVCSHGAYCAVFTAGAGYFLTGDAPLDFALTRFCAHGCVAHRTIKSVRNWLIWLAPDGVYAWVDGVAQLISDDQRATIDAMTAAEQAGAHAVVWEDKYMLMWPTGCIVFDLQHRVWTTNTNYTWQDSAVSQHTGSTKERVYAAQVGAARVFQLETGATDNGTAIPTVWAGKDWDMGAPGREKRAHYIEARFKKGTGTATATLKTGSGKTVQTKAHDISAVDDAAETVSRLFEPCVEQARSEFFRLEIACSTTASEYELHAVALHHQVAT